LRHLKFEFLLYGFHGSFLYSTIGSNPKTMYLI
jgi:hypothetical protein